MTWDTVYKILTIIMATGICGGIAHLLIWMIRLEPRIQFMEASMIEIKEQLKSWDGKTERRKKAYE